MEGKAVCVKYMPDCKLISQNAHAQYQANNKLELFKSVCTVITIIKILKDSYYVCLNRNKGIFRPFSLA